MSYNRGHLFGAVLPVRLVMFLFSAVLFYGGWIYCVVGASRGDSLVPPLITWLFVGAQLVLVGMRSRELLRMDLMLIGITCIVGLCVESVFVSSGVFAYASPNPLVPWMAPFWVVTIYALLAICLNHSLSWLRGRLMLASILGAASAFFCYAAVERMYGLTFTISNVAALILISLTWFLLFPGLLMVANLLHGYPANGSKRV